MRSCHSRILQPSSNNRILLMASASATTSSSHSGTIDQDESLDNHLMEIAKKLKLEIFDLDEGIYGFDSQDQHYGIEVVKTDIVVDQRKGIGLVLMEVAGDEDGRGLVLVREITGAAAQAAPQQIQVGDVVTGAWAGEGKQRVQERTTGLNYDLTVECLIRVKAAAVATPKSVLTLQLNRLVERAPIRVEVDDGSGEIQIVDALAGENLRRLLLRRGIPLYDRQTKRFDMPYATGDCAGDGLCGTCLVAVEQGMQGLNDPDNHEKVITKGRPMSWRAACRTTIGADNRPATLRIATHPQSRFVEELDPGVRHLDSEM
jgi:ferredoxin